QSVGGGGGNGGVNVSAALSLAGDGSGAVGVGIGGSGGDGGDGASASGAVTGDVTTTGDDSAGVTVQSLGGGGGNGGLTVSGAISIAGTGSGAAAIGVGGFGGGGGTAGDVDGSFDGILSTTGDRSAGVVAQSLGGGGGNGGTNISGAISLAPDFSGALGIGVGGFGGDGGAAGSVDHSVAGLVETAGEDSIGILTQSLGGGGGNGGTNISAALSLSRDVSAGIGIGVGGFGGLGADAGATTVSSVTGGVLTTGYRSGGIVTQSLGGGGGNGGTNVSAAVSLSQNNGGAIGLGLGGFGAGAGAGKSVSSTVRTTAAHDSIATEGAESIGVLAQSVGGAGGSGGLNVSGAVSLTGKSGAAIGLGVGGFGGGGGDAGPVALDVAGTIDTRGDKSHGLMAQSLGGGGGVGGTNVSGSLSLTKPSGSDTILSISAGVGGFGGGGGNAGDVDLSYTGALTAIPRTVQAGGSLAVDAKSGADGLVAQSIGGGGGSGGTSVSAGLSISSKPGAGQTDASKSYAVLVGVGGFGGTGGDAGAVTVDVGAGSTIDAHGTGRSGILAQSVGGGGGNGGLNVSGGIVSDSSLIVGVGGFGGNAGTAGDVAVTARADIAVTTDPDDLVEPSTDSFETTLRSILGDDIVDAAEGLAESKGLKGLFTQLGLFDSEASETEGSAGLLAQSLGGGGGNGGLNVSGGVAIDKDGKIPSITFGIGGFGGAGNVSGGVTVDHAGAIDVAGNWKHGIFAQSVAGGGGNGALNVSGQLNWNGSKTSDGATDLSIVAGLGGHGGLGADAGDVAVTSDGDITATGYHARGLFAQSLGGGGGTGGVNVTAIGTKNSSPVGIGVGGFGAGGGDAGSVTVTRGSAAAAAGLITTDGVGANGIEASSIGGGGGDAGVNAVLGFSKAAGSKSDSGSSSDRKTPTHTGVDASVIANYNSVLDELEGKTNPTPAGGEKTSVSGLFAIGGSAGNAGNAGTVDIAHFGDVLTLDDSSHGVFGQSLGGGGGNAALNFGMIYQSGNSEQTKGFGLAVGGGTGDGGTGAAVTLDNVGAVVTTGADSHGIFAQSVGGGGGNAGYSSLTNAGEGGSVAIQIGRTGGTGGAAGSVHASSEGTVLTQGDRSHGLFAQSVGNGGGNSTATSVTLGTPKTSDDKGSSFKLSVGLEGGQGGAAGDVDVAATGALTTLGTDAHGVFAQSVGGGGGTGGGASGSAGAGKSLSISIGGTGGTGGTGGKVSVASTAGILTGADRSIGILAQSVGGAGGTGGYAKSGVTAMSFLKNTVKGSDIGTTASLSIGGSGGAGMASDQVDVVNQGTIGTYGGSAHGIFAQSVGGGGGKGGLVQNNIVNLRGSIGNQASISVGGTGGTGAVSGDVSVSNQGEIRTRSTKSAGIYAQAVGGGGGDAQNVTNIFLGTSADNTSNNAMLLGGTGGTGGAAGDVSVVNDSGALIATLGSESHGVLAQSVGGGGGQGGNVISVSLSKPGAGAKQARGAQLAIGGTGGQGGTGGTVAVTNRGQITTTGGAAHGIVAQSVGGGGGIGGTSVIGTLSIRSGTEGDPSLGFALGGAGGSGNTGGAVTVRNVGAIAVSGDKAYGVLAQSVGGGGGDGGLAMSLSGNDLANRAAGKSYSKIAVGGAGGDGADGGDVVVRHSGTIAVGGDDAYGIFAQSVGGGGGSAGFSVSAPAAMALDYLFSTVLGAREGAKGTAGTVTVDSTGDIAMSGTNAQAILTQTVNGGGGNVDTFVDFGTFTSGTAETGTAPALAGSISLGGDDADQTAGSAVDATHSGDLSTQGDRSVASLTQSIGGGGGNGGAAFVLDPSSAIALDLNLGAKDTDDAGGGDVTLARTGSVATIGIQSQAVSVQSIGGGGGRLATDVSRGGASAQAKATAALVLGADPSFNNPGGDLDLDLSGETVTLGDYSPGLVLQSIGAGGGQSYLTGLTRAEVEIGASDGSSGDGGDITLANAGAVLAAGSRSDGIVLQSIGGGGGYVRTDLGAAALTVTASADNAGDGGDISLVQSGTVHAAGAGAIGILAQSLGGGGGLVDQVFRGSAGGDGSGGAIALTADGNVVADAAGGVAILAQSEGRNGGGRVTLGLDGVIKGGSGTGAAAIAVTGGSENRVDLGSNGFVFALNNVAITGSSGNDRIVSKAGVVGNIDLGGGRNRLTNAASGTLVTHETLDLGRDGLLTNAGLLVPGGDVVQSGLGASASRSDFTTTRNVPQTTTLVGSLLMTPTSRFQIDVSYRASGAAGDGSDLIRTTGSVTFDGLVAPTLLSLERLFPLTIIESGGAAVDRGATVLDTATIDYSIAIGSIELAATPDFSLPGMTGNQGAVGDHINAILTGDGSAALGPLFALIGNMTDAGEVAATLDRLTTEGYAANRVATLFSGLGFAAGIGDCERRKSREFDLARGECWWLETQGDRFEQDPFDGYRSLGIRSNSMIGGVERAIDDNWTAGFALGYESLDVTSGDSFSSDADRGHLGVSIFRRTGPLVLGAALTGSFGQFESTRYVGVSGTLPDGNAVSLVSAESTQTITQANLGLRAAYTLQNPGSQVYARPSIDLDASYIYASQADESGEAAFGMEVGSTSEWVLSMSPTVEVGGTFRSDAGALVHPFLRGGFTLFDTDRLEIDSAFIGAPESAGRFQNASGFDRLLGRVNAGLDIGSENSSSRVELGYYGVFSEHSTLHGLGVNWTMRF
ncbi:MAG: autotransporter outer membrane beta-barrel domain-containing protein, partial [Rhodovulum sp.]|nr:autotransporter outer membrane beta-barrel domain-containing protein [Rhodovulum sp.]